MSSIALESKNTKSGKGFTPAQYELVNMVSCLRSDRDVAAPKAVLVRFLDSRLQDELNGLQAEGKLSDETIESFATSHFRTHYGVAR